MHCQDARCKARPLLLQAATAAVPSQAPATHSRAAPAARAPAGAAAPPAGSSCWSWPCGSGLQGAGGAAVGARQQAESTSERPAGGLPAAQGLAPPPRTKRLVLHALLVGAQAAVEVAHGGGVLREGSRRRRAAAAGGGEREKRERALPLPRLCPSLLPVERPPAAPPHLEAQQALARPPLQPLDEVQHAHGLPILTPAAGTGTGQRAGAGQVDGGQAVGGSRARRFTGCRRHPARPAAGSCNLIRRTAGRQSGGAWRRTGGPTAAAQSPA